MSKAETPLMPPDVGRSLAKMAQRLPTSEPARRIAILYHRRLTTAWDPKEIRVFRRLCKDGCFETPDDLDLLERYYAAEMRKGDRGVHRRDLYTLLNNWPGELDRATAWSLRHPKPRKIIPMPLMATPEPKYEPIDEAAVARFREDFARSRGRPLLSAPLARCVRGPIPHPPPTLWPE